MPVRYNNLVDYAKSVGVKQRRDIILCLQQYGPMPPSILADQTGIGQSGLRAQLVKLEESQTIRWDRGGGQLDVGLVTLIKDINMG